MAKRAISKENSVHCEVKLLVSIEKHQTTPGSPKAFTYIGVSKLSCHGCDSFIRAFNAVHHTFWVTKGAHGKSCYPWMFPPGTPAEELVRTKTYANLAFDWAKSYQGYRELHVSLQPDSTAQSAQSTTAYISGTIRGQGTDAEYTAAFERRSLRMGPP
jgi:hypothetical protein